jgi:hypothetical protein
MCGHCVGGKNVYNSRGHFNPTHNFASYKELKPAKIIDHSVVIVILFHIVASFEENGSFVCAHKPRGNNFGRQREQIVCDACVFVLVEHDEKKCL